MNSIRRRRTMLMTAQSYDCIVALYLHNIFLFTSLLVEFYFSIWKSCIWWGENLFFFYSIYFVYFVCMHEDQTMTDIVLILILCMYMKWKWNQILKMCMHWFSSDIVQWMTTKIRLQRMSNSQMFRTENFPTSLLNHSLG